MVDAGGEFGVALLDGVTGSGKTEVYLEAAAAVLRRDVDAQVLILLPEIALTEAVIDRIAARFGAEPAAWHSGLHPTHRRRVWEAVALGKCRIVVGARSALFLPFRRLRLIAVDEEHDASYKQEDGFIYQARDLAVARGKIADALVILASATPSLETLWNARDRSLPLAEARSPPRRRRVAVDRPRRSAPPSAGGRPVAVAPAGRRDAARRWRGARQVLLFLNRAWRLRPDGAVQGLRRAAEGARQRVVARRAPLHGPASSATLTGFSMKKPDRCPYCTAKDSLVSVGPGVERVEEEARALFPAARIAVFSSDTASGPQAARELIAAMTDSEIDILVATQGAAKGHNFPNLTLVGVVDADLGLRGGDLRAAERTFQLIAQVAGRRRAQGAAPAARCCRPGRPSTR